VTTPSGLAKPMRLLALSPVPPEGAGCRFRVMQYVPALERAGFVVTVAPFFDTAFFRLVYRPGHYAAKVRALVRQSVERLRLLTARSQYDAYLVYREAYPFGPALFETLLARMPGRPLVYDFDDAIFLNNSSEANRFTSALKYPQKVAAIIRRSALVLAGNQYLADYARAYNPAVTVLPTCVDTTVFVPPPAPPTAGATPVVGWIGTPTTAAYLKSIASPLASVAKTHPFVLRVSGAGDEIQLDGVNTANAPWRLEREVELFNTCDVGVYPLPDDEWARGKCGFKAIQFMSCGVPVVAAAVGVNREIIQDGVNGFLASSDDEWVAKVGCLLENPELRRRLGAAGRRTIEERYSLSVNAPMLASMLCGVTGRGRGGNGDTAGGPDRRA
jgi:glycosyltransferase involved in cell wall biosynthesis